MNLKSQLSNPKSQIISKSEISITETFRSLKRCSVTIAPVLSFGHWYLFEIWFLALGILMIFIDQVSFVNSANYLYK